MSSEPESKPLYEKNIYMALLAQQCSRYKEMFKYFEELIKQREKEGKSCLMGSSTNNFFLMKNKEEKNTIENNVSTNMTSNNLIGNESESDVSKNVKNYKKNSFHNNNGNIKLNIIRLKKKDNYSKLIIFFI